VKLQDAYVGESNQIGSWTLIGYTGPGTKIASQTDSTETTNFLYGGGAYKGSDGKATIGGEAVTAAVGWIATSKVALNDVAIGASWTLSVAAAASESLVSYTATVPSGAESLTPNFTALSH
jgi:hypothetical protein